MSSVKTWGTISADTENTESSEKERKSCHEGKREKTLLSKFFLRPFSVIDWQGMKKRLKNGLQ